MGRRRCMCIHTYKAAVLEPAFAEGQTAANGKPDSRRRQLKAAGVALAAPPGSLVLLHHPLSRARLNSGLNAQPCLAIPLSCARCPELRPLGWFRSTDSRARASVNPDAPMGTTTWTGVDRVVEPTSWAGQKPTRTYSVVLLDSGILQAPMRDWICPAPGQPARRRSRVRYDIFSHIKLLDTGRLGGGCGRPLGQPPRGPLGRPIRPAWMQDACEERSPARQADRAMHR